MSLNLLTKIDFKPRPANEAAKAFGRKTAVTSDVFEALSQRAKALAFRIAGVHKASLIQRARDIVKKAIRDGTPYADVRRKLLELFDTEGIPRPALSRLRATFQHSAQQAYNDSRRELLDEPDVTAAFPFREYFTVGNGTPGVNGVRATHAALHGLVFRWDDPFWNSFTPPWEFGCRCGIRPLTAGMVKRGRIKVRNAGFVTKGLRVQGQRRRGLSPNKAFDRSKPDFKGIDSEIRRAIEGALG